MATTPTDSYEYTPNPYLEEAYQKELLAIDEAQKQYQIQADRENEKALQTQLESNRGATADYYNYINPYGIQAEAMANTGLKGSGLTQSNMARGYSDYQNRLGQAASAYANSQTDISTQLLSAQAQANADKLTTLADYNSNLYTDYWQNKNYDYQKNRDDVSDERYEEELAYQRERDKIADKRYDAEWAYEIKKNNSSSSSSGSGGSEKTSKWKYDPREPVDISKAYSRFMEDGLCKKEHEYWRKIYFLKKSRAAESRGKTIINKE
jgi:hypothetical protein